MQWLDHLFVGRRRYKDQSKHWPTWKQIPQAKRDFWLLLGIGLLGMLTERLWFWLDQSVPSWDPSEHFNGSMTYWSLLGRAEITSGAWWREFWMASPKYPPLLYILTAPFYALFGTGIDQATLVNLLFGLILMWAVYSLGQHLFSSTVGLWAAVLVWLTPHLYTARTEFLLDYPTTALVTLALYYLTRWRDTHKLAQRWDWTLASGISIGLALLCKQTALLFLLVPLLWLGLESLTQRAWGRFGQWLISLCTVGLVLWPWYRTNWLLILTSSNRAVIESAALEGDPPLNALAAWTYYAANLPRALSWPLLLVPLVGLLLYIWRAWPSSQQRRSLTWLGGCWAGAYLLCSVVVNKDSRYILPYLPLLIVLLAYGLSLWPRALLGRIARWGTLALASWLMLTNLFPIGGGWLAGVLSPGARHWPDLKGGWPPASVVAAVAQAEPYLSANIGVLPSLPGLNQGNVSYYGALADFQVYGRQVGVQAAYIQPDLKALDWLVTKTGDPGSVRDAYPLVVKTLEADPAFRVMQTWSLPDQSQLKLFQRKQPTVRVMPLPQAVSSVQLVDVVLPDRVPPGSIVPVTYRWRGPWSDLKSGLMLLEWQGANQARLLQDHSLGLGRLYGERRGSYEIQETLGLQVPKRLAAGNYTLSATYLNRQGTWLERLKLPPIQIRVDATAPAVANSPAPDLVTQFRALAAQLPRGRLEPIFTAIARISQYDPNQDYVNQAALAAAYRLQQEPQNLALAYQLALARVLQRRAPEAIKAFERVVRLSPRNPYAYTYLAFVNLYDFHPRAAERALVIARNLSPQLPEVRTLSGVAALMQGNFNRAWSYFHSTS
ncbi:glycosyltransferase family 39 protein [Leptolyngbya sp. FACHB-261]|uniref:glycosyltransferase family 39 protein n=1 Tax=Leptolyngbya sp. FACHB-261 TaxID=2692806 RepID=UPI0016850D1C|nr:glycosyltransferase family 39 protein [Leptolyngbya sp. FACHB-261]MBD2105123.1 glycosyltransferase family 39 protein [Leptolyngbya sp. FACHB-261]